MTKEKDKFIIIDANAVLHRAWHALPELKGPDGKLTNAVYGFTSVLIKILKEFNPKYAAVCFDVKAPTFRHQEYKEYKAQRIKQPDEFYDQIPLAKEITASFDIPILGKDGYEADDLIGTIANSQQTKKELENDSLENIIVTGDLDALQLVNKNTRVYNLKKGINEIAIYDQQAVKERYGLVPEQLIDYKALRGDPSDNIPGVKGIGEKTGAELIQKFGTLENLYQQLENNQAIGISDRIKNLLLEQKSDALASKRLVTIVKDVPIDFDLEDYRMKGVDLNKINKSFGKLGFYSLIKRANDIWGAKQTALI